MNTESLFLYKRLVSVNYEQLDYCKCICFVSYNCVNNVDK